MELLQGLSYGKKDESSLDNPGGAGEFPSLFRRDSRAKIEENRRKEWNHILNMEQRLLEIHSKLGIREAEVEQVQQEKSQEGTSSYG